MSDEIRLSRGTGLAGTFCARSDSPSGWYTIVQRERYGWAEEAIRLLPEEALAFARQLPEVKALVEALRAAEKKMRHSAPGTTFSWCAICGEGDMHTGKIDHAPNCPFATLMPFEEAANVQP